MSPKHPLRYALDLGGRTFPVRTIEGTEAMSAPFSLELRFPFEGEVPAPEELLRRVATVNLHRDGEVVRRIVGVVTEAAVSGAVRGVPEGRVVVEPPIALLRHRVDFRVFRDKTVPQIVEEVFDPIAVRPGAPEGPSRLELRLAGSYAPRPYCVQCRESDLDFVHRLLEDEGIHYFFLEHGGMVLGDSPGAYDVIAGDRRVPFRPAAGLDRHEDAIVSVARRARMSVGKVSLRDFDLARPSLGLDVEAAGPTPGGPEFYDYPGEYADPSEGARKARLHAEAFACAAAGSSGESLSGRLLPGHVFELEGSPDGANDGRRVVTRVAHRWTRDETGFSCAFDALGADVVFRPRRATPVPTLVNPMTAFVTGPSGEDVHTDELGRVKIRFPWDRTQPHDDRSSDWVPVLQDNTGHSIGIPRVGWEVLVHFLEGDPDRPVVLGRMYNAEDTFPADLPAGKTKSALKSMSSPGRGGTNQIELDDAAGREKISIVAQRDKDVFVAHDKGSRALHDRQRKVGKDDAIAVARDATAWVGKEQSHYVIGNQTRKVGGSRSRSVGGSETSAVDGNRTLTIGGLHFRRVSKDDTVSAKDLVETVGAVDLELSVKTNTASAANLLAVTVGGAHVEVVKEGKSESAKYARAETVGGNVVTRSKATISTRVDKKRLVFVGGAMGVKAKGKLALAAGEKLSMAARKGSLTAAKEITLKVDESTVILKPGLVSVQSTDVVFVMKGKARLESGGFALVPTGSGDASVGSATLAANVTGGGAVDPKAALAKATEAAVDKTSRPGEPAAPWDACNVSVRRMLDTYNEATGLGLWSPGAGQKANDIVQSLGAMAAAGQNVEIVDAARAQQIANEGGVVIAGLASSSGSGHVTTVSPGNGKDKNGNFYPNVTGGGSSHWGQSTGDKTVGDVWKQSDAKNVTYYHVLPPPPPPPPPPTPPTSTRT